MATLSTLMGALPPLCELHADRHSAWIEVLDDSGKNRVIQALESLGIRPLREGADENAFWNEGEGDYESYGVIKIYIVEG